MNSKQELLDVIERLSDNHIVCAEISYKNCWDYDSEAKTFTLKAFHTPEELESFLNSLDFTYDDGFGGQELFGTVWLTNGIWLSRGEYDGSEWWEIHSYPTIPDHLK